MNLNPYEIPLGVEEPTQESSSRQPDLSGELADSMFMHAAVCVVASYFVFFRHLSPSRVRCIG